METDESVKKPETTDMEHAGDKLDVCKARLREIISKSDTGGTVQCRYGQRCGSDRQLLLCCAVAVMLMKPHKFDKDNEGNFHIDIINAAAV